jgi:N-methylhydantoinase A
MRCVDNSHVSICDRETIMTKQLAVDIGGTFVDAIVFDSETGEIQQKKLSTTPDNPAEGVLQSIDKLDASVDNVESFIHGTTLSLNAVLESEGARTGIITNEGFVDVFEMGRYDRPAEDMFKTPYYKPDPLVQGRNRVGVAGRMSPDGDIVEPLDEEGVREASDTLVKENGVESIVVCFLHSYRNPDHEQWVADVIRNRHPEVSVSVSSDIVREYREYERISTSVLDGYIKPIFESYVERLNQSMTDAGFDGSFYITRSGGGAVLADDAKSVPVHTLLSGPAGGLIGAAHIGEQIGHPNVIAADVGGTSLDVCVVQDGSPTIRHESALENLNLPVIMPIYDIRTLGAGGGSIAWVDNGLLKVGPESAGADPGPICYGEGGTEPTVTDAALRLGYLDPDNFLGGEFSLAVEEAYQGIDEKVATSLDMSVLEASRGIFDVTKVGTVTAIRQITVERGLDPRDFAMVAYGGAGPLFLPLVAREMELDEVVIPRSPSVFSAKGMLMTDVVHDFSQTYLQGLDNVDLSEVESKFQELESQATDALAEGEFSSAQRDLERTAELRYRGQEHTVEVSLGDISSKRDVHESFEDEHSHRYGHRMDDPVEFVHLRVRGRGRTDTPDFEREDPEEGKSRERTRDAYCFAADEMLPFCVMARRTLESGDTVKGPAIIQEPTSTLVFYSDQTATVDELGNIIVTINGDN